MGKSGILTLVSAVCVMGDVDCLWAQVPGIATVLVAQAEPTTGNPFKSQPAAEAPKASNPFSAGGAAAKPKPPAAPARETEKPMAETPADEPAKTPPAETPASPAPDSTPAAEAAAGLHGGVKPGARWTVTPDPADFAPLGNVRFSIPIPGLLANADPRWERSHLRVLFPQVPSGIVGLGLNEKETDAREIWDIVNNRKVGVVTKLGLEGSRLLGLSPDGSYFAAKPQFDEAVSIVNVATGATVKSLALVDTRLDMLAFSSNALLLLGQTGRVQKFAIPTGKPQGEITIEGWNPRDGWQLSPGGKFLAAVLREGNDRNRLAFFDIASGDRIGDLILAEKDGDCLGVAFSWNGRSLAAVVSQGPDLFLETFDLAEPSVTAEVPIDGSSVGEADAYQGNFLEWLPDGARLLMAGRAVINASSGETQETLSGTPLYAVRPVSGRHYAGVEDTKLVARAFDNSAPAAAAELPIAVETPTAPREGADTGRPPLTTAVRTGAKQITHPTAARWDVRLAAPPVYKNKLTTSGVKIPRGFINQIQLSVNDPPLAVVSYSSEPLNGSNAHGVKTWVELFNLQSGESFDTFSFPMPAVCTGVSPDGQRVVTVSTDDLGRVDVWSPLGNQHLFGFRPASASADDLIPWFADMVDQDHVLTAVGDELSLWKLPECQAVYTMTIDDMRPAFSPAKDHVMVSVPGLPHVFVLESLTGVVRGAINSSPDPGERPVAAAFHHRGRWAACLTSSASGGELAVVDTVTGESTVRTKLPVSGQVLQWCGDGHVLLDGRQLISLRAENVVWNYELADGLHCREPIDARHWYVTMISPNDKSYVLYGASLPEDAAVKQIESAILPKNVLFRPGDKIRIDVLADGDGPGSVGRKISEAFIQKYAAAKSAASSDATATFSVHPYDPNRPKPKVTAPLAPSASTGGLLQGAPSQIDLLTRTTATPKPKDEAAAPAAPKVPLSNVWELSLTVDKHVLWRAWLAADSKGVVLVSSEAEARARRDDEPAKIQLAIAALLTLDPPLFGFSPGAGAGAGQSQLTINGPRRPSK